MLDKNFLALDYSVPSVSAYCLLVDVPLERLMKYSYVRLVAMVMGTPQFYPSVIRLIRLTFE